jgi:succinate dehydrogenase flavin-adding protein (antitoxin of CptAB toxin-antitoxin module)
MKSTTINMTEIKEAIEVATNTQQKLSQRGLPESDKILIKFLGQVLTSLQTKVAELDNASTTQ